MRQTLGELRIDLAAGASMGGLTPAGCKAAVDAIDAALSTESGGLDMGPESIIGDLEALEAHLLANRGYNLNRAQGVRMAIERIQLCLRIRSSGL